MELTVLILARDEGRSLERLLPEVHRALATIPGPTEILVVDGRSEDDTVQVAARLGARVVVQGGRGYGDAFRTGIAAAGGTFVCSLDADGSHHPFYLRQLYAHRHEAAAVIGSRYCFQGHYHGQPVRHVLSRLLNAVFGRVLALPIRDLSSGLRLYRRAAVAGLPLVGFDFDILQEVLVRLYVAGYRAVEIPIHFQPRAEGSSKARLLRFAWSYLKTLFRLWRVRNAADAADYDDRAFSSLLLPKRWWQRQRYRTVLAFASGATGPALDAGCGSSRILAALPHAVGLDRAVPQLRFRTITNTRLAAGDCRRLPFADDVFGLAIASQLVEHNEDADACLDELARVLRPGGVLIVGTPDYGRARWRIAEALHRALVPAAAADRHVNRFTRQGLFVALERRGFTVERHAYVFGAELIVRVRKGGADR